jgi:CRP/FNR family transcriptional regulator, cyclic AMP receptor protein
MEPTRVPGSANALYSPAVALQFFKSEGKLHDIPQGKTIFSESQKALPLLLMRQRMYLLLEGEVSVLANDTPIATVNKGEIFGEMASINQTPRSAAAVAKTPCRVITLDDKQFQAALAKRPEFALMLMSVMVQRLRDNIGRLSANDTLKGADWKEASVLQQDVLVALEQQIGPAARFRYNAGKLVMREGAVGVVAYVVLEGRVSITIGDTVMEKVGPGGIFGEMALVERTPRLASAAAETDCVLLAVSRLEFVRLVKNNPRFGAQLLSAVSERARSTASRQAA